MSQEKVVIVGQGYVGLPLAALCVASGWNTVGLESNSSQINSIISGDHDLLSSEGKRVIATGLEDQNYEVTDDFTRVVGAEIVIYCLPTPLDPDRNPDLSILLKALNDTGPYVSANSLLILESTSYPGTTRDFFAAHLVNNFNNCSSCDFAFSPERVDPNNQIWNLSNTPKIVAGLTEHAKVRAVKFYEDILETVVPVDSLEIAELAKLIENTYRLVNISFINELQIASNKLGIPIRKAIEAANTKPYGFQPFYPSAGIGGHCIPVDPVYLNWASTQFGFPLRMVETALEINDGMATFVVERLQQLGVVTPSTILLAGIAYKPGIADIRESPSKHVARELKARGYEITWCDIHVKEWAEALKFDPKDNSVAALIILQEIEQEMLDFAIRKEIPILDCTGKYNSPGIHQL
jgi:UDP-N-acetyl-D-glucosamine dehydrogenase